MSEVVMVGPEETPRFKNDPMNIADEIEIARLEIDEEHLALAAARTDAENFAIACRGIMYLALTLMFVFGAYALGMFGKALSA